MSLVENQFPSGGWSLKLYFHWSSFQGLHILIRFHARSQQEIEMKILAGTVDLESLNLNWMLYSSILNREQSWTRCEQVKRFARIYRAWIINLGATKRCWSSFPNFLDWSLFLRISIRWFAYSLEETWIFFRLYSNNHRLLLVSATLSIGKRSIWPRF